MVIEKRDNYIRLGVIGNKLDGKFDSFQFCYAIIEFKTRHIIALNCHSRTRLSDTTNHDTVIRL